MTVRPGSRVGVLVNALDLGGAEQLVAALLRTWRDVSKLELVVFVMRGGGLLDAVVEGSGWPVQEIGGGSRLDPRLPSRLASAVRREGISLLHAHLPRSGVLAALVGPRCGIPTVYTEHSFWSAYRTPTRLSHLATLSRHSAIVAVSHPVRDFLAARRRDLASKLTVVENGVDIDMLRRALPQRERIRSTLGLRGSDLLILNVGNLRRVKNHAGLLRAFSALTDDVRPHARLLIAGRDDGERRGLQQLASQLGISDDVHFAGPRQDVPELIAACDVFALSSTVEGLPLALLEAGALGKPSVATRVGGVPDAVTEDSGRVVEPEDDAALGAALSDLLRNPELRHRMGQAAEGLVRSRFSIERTAAAYAAIYSRLVPAHA